MKLGRGFTYRSIRDQPELLDLMEELLREHGPIDLTATPRMSRAQQNAERGACRELSKVLNDAGMDMVHVLKPGDRCDGIPWIPESVHESLYLPVLKSMYGLDSSTKMDREMPKKVWDALSMRLSQHLGITPPPWRTARGPELGD